MADLKRTDYPENVWARTHRGREGTVRWYRRVYDRLAEVGFSAPIMAELHSSVEELERRSVVAERV